MSGQDHGVCRCVAAAVTATVLLVLAMPAAGRAQQVRADTVVELPGVDVTAASRIPGGGITRAAEVIDRAALLRLPASTLVEALRWGLGVDLQPRSAAQSDLSLRGGSFEQVLVLVDGIPVSDPQTGHFDLDLTIPLELVERIEVVRGPASSVHGSDAMGGVVNVVTRAPATRAFGSVRMEGGSFASRTGAAVVGVPLSAGWGVLAAVQADASDGHRAGIDHRARLGHLVASGPLAGGTLRLQGGWAARDFGADGFYAPWPSYEETRAGLVAAQWTGPALGRDATVRIFRRTHDDDFVLRREDPGFYRNLHAVVQTGAEASAGWVLADGVRMVAGAQLLHDGLTSESLGDRDELRGAGYAEAGLDRGVVRVRGGVRVEGREGFGLWVAPSVSGSVEVARSLRARALLGRSLRTPTFTERFYRDPANVGRADLEPESAWTGELGLDWAPPLIPRGALVRVTAFRRAARDLVDWARPLDAAEVPLTEVPWQTRNVGAADFDGLEVQIEGVRMARVSLQGAASWLSLEATDAAGLVSKYALRPLVRSLMLGAGIALPADWRAEVRVLERERRGDSEGHVLVDARMAVPLFAGEVRFDLTNLFDERHPDITGLPAAGRALRVGARFPFGPVDAR